MPTRKQRRRRQKDLRHEWEEVYVDAEGRELPPEQVEEILPRKVKEDRKPAARGGGRQQRGRAPRGIEPASWRRVFKRAAIFAPIMYVFITLIDRQNSWVVNLIVTLQLLILFIPFSYLMDSLTYRMWRKRQAKLNA